MPLSDEVAFNRKVSEVMEFVSDSVQNHKLLNYLKGKGQIYEIASCISTHNILS